MPDFSFAGQTALVPVVARELPQAALGLPLGFSELDGRMRLVALLSVFQGQNLFVAPDGKWLGTYVPAWIRLYPFRLIGGASENELVLCIDEDSGAIVDGSAKGQPIFDADGNLGTSVKQILGQLGELENSRKVTDAAVDALVQSTVIGEWSITLRTEQGEQRVAGINRVDEATLTALPEKAFLTLRQTAAFAIGYAQLLSMGHVNLLVELFKFRSKLAQTRSSRLPESLDSLFTLSQDDTIRFR